MQLSLLDIQVIGDELALRWSDGAESYFSLEALRRACPCAGCSGEPDALGRVYRPEVTYDAARSFGLRSYGMVGGYAFQPVWFDGHSTGLYSFDYLRRLGKPEAQPS